MVNKMFDMSIDNCSDSIDSVGKKLRKIRIECVTLIRITVFNYCYLIPIP